LQLNELSSAVDVAAENPARFNLTADEVASRRKWIENTRRQVSMGHRHAPSLFLTLEGAKKKGSSNHAGWTGDMQPHCCHGVAVVPPVQQNGYFSICQLPLYPQVNGIKDTLKTATASTSISPQENRFAVANEKFVQSEYQKQQMIMQ
jgi:hypothetical protein